MSENHPTDPNTVAVTDPPQNNGVPGMETFPRTQLPENPFLVKAKEEAVKPKRPSLFSIVVRGKKVRPFMTVVAGGPGIGKSTLGAASESPIFVPTERGLDQIGPERFPIPKTYLEFKRYIHAIDTDPEFSNYETLVIDTIDGLESLIWDEVCEEKKCNSIEEPGYGEGYTAAQTKWHTLLRGNEKGFGGLVSMSEKMNVLLLAHQHIKTFKDPSQIDPYDVYKIKLNDKSAAVIRESVDNILFATHDVTMTKEDPSNKKDKKGKALYSGDRILQTVADTGYPDCKNRYNLPKQIPLEWSSLAEGVAKFYAE